MHVMTSYHEGLPAMVLVVVDETVDRCVIATDYDTEIEIELSAPYPILRKRFGAGNLPAENDEISWMRAETAGSIVDRQPEQGTYQRRNRPFPSAREPTNEGAANA
jgi:hypothetical protein